jgi:hypothetical protein
MVNEYLLVWAVRFLKAQTRMSVPPILSSGILMPGSARLLPGMNNLDRLEGGPIEPHQDRLGRSLAVPMPTYATLLPIETVT